MKKHNLLATCIIVICFSLGAGAAKAQEPWESPQSTAGAAKAQEPWESPQSTAGAATVQSVTPLISNPVAIDPSFSAIPAPFPPPPGAPPAAPPKVAGTTEVGFQTIYSTHMQVYRIPMSYAFTDNFKMEINVPYVRKELRGEYTNKNLSTDGLGDISLGAKYHYSDAAGKIQGMTSFYLKLPTGEEKQFKGRREQLALGTGSYDLVINQTATAFFRNVMVIGNFGYAFNTGSDYTTNNWGRNVKYENEAGNVFNYLVDAEYYTPVRRLVAYMNMAGLIMGRSHIKETYLDGLGGDRDENKKDRLKTMDFGAGVKYLVTEKTCLRLGFVAPVWTDFDPDANDTEGRDWLINFGFAGRF